MIDYLGDRMKEYEKNAPSVAPQGTPLIVRLDGKAFHSFTRWFEKPYDDHLVYLMQTTAKYLAHLHHANVGYVQSDEISLCWHTNSKERQQIFGGKKQKLESILASQCSVYFNRLLHNLEAELAALMPVFDCRAFTVPTISEATNYFVWRQNDAIRNSINSAGFLHFSKTELVGKKQIEIVKMLEDIGVDWNDYPKHFKYGTFYIPYYCLDAESYKRKTYEITEVGLLKNNPERIKELFGDTR